MSEDEKRAARSEAPSGLRCGTLAVLSLLHGWDCRSSMMKWWIVTGLLAFVLAIVILGQLAFRPSSDHSQPGHEQAAQQKTPEHQRQNVSGHIEANDSGVAAE